MKFTIAITAVGDDSISSLIQSKRTVFSVVSERIESRCAEIGLLTRMPESYFVYAYHRFDGLTRGEFRYLRDQRWRDNRRTKDYCAYFDLDIVQFEDYGPQELEFENELIKCYERAGVAVVAQLSLEYEDPTSKVSAFVDGFDLDWSAIQQAHEAFNLSRKPSSRKLNALATKKTVVGSLEISFSADGLTPTEAFDRRQRISDLVSAAFRKAQLGEAEGFSSGSGTYDIGFLVSDFGKAKKLVELTLREHGVDPKTFTIYSLDH